MKVKLMKEPNKGMSIHDIVQQDHPNAKWTRNNNAGNQWVGKGKPLDLPANEMLMSDRLMALRMSEEKRKQTLVQRAADKNTDKLFPKDDDSLIMKTYVPFLHGRLLEHRMGKTLGLCSEYELAELIDSYIFQCEKDQLLPSVIGLCSWLGIGRDSLDKWIADSTLTGNEILKKSLTYIHNIKENAAEKGYINPIIHMFTSKNYHGMADKKEVEHTVKGAETLDNREQNDILNDLPIDVFEYEDGKFQ